MLELRSSISVFECYKGVFAKIFKNWWHKLSASGFKHARIKPRKREGHSIGENSGLFGTSKSLKIYMIYLTKILDFSLYHISKDDSTLCGLNLLDRQFELENILPENKFICNKCQRIKKRHDFEYQLNQKKDINHVGEALKFYGISHVLFSITNEMERAIFGLEEAIDYSSTDFFDSLESPETQFEASVNKGKIQVSYTLREEIWNPEIEFSKLEHFSSVIKKRVFESLKERRN